MYDRTPTQSPLSSQLKPHGNLLFGLASFWWILSHLLHCPREPVPNGVEVLGTHSLLAVNWEYRLRISLVLQCGADVGRGVCYSVRWLLTPAPYIISSSVVR